MEFRISCRFLKLWTSSKKRSANLITKRCINGEVPYGIILTKPQRTIQRGSHGNVCGFGFLNDSNHHPKVIQKMKLFLQFLKKLMTKNIAKEELEDDWGGPEPFKLITFIKDDFDGVLKKHSDILVLFSASWCPHCRKLRKPYGMAAIMSKEANLPMTFATFDVGQYPDVADEKGVIGIPLIRYYKDAKFVTNYKGKRTAEDLFNFAKNPQEDSSKAKQPDI